MDHGMHDDSVQGDALGRNVGVCTTLLALESDTHIQVKKSSHISFP